MASPATPEFFYSSTAPKMTLTTPATSAATTLQVDTVTGLPGSTPFKLVLDPGLSGEEIVKVTNVSGTTLTVIRGWDGTAAQSHANLSEVRHMVTAEDLRLSREHESSWREVHGVNGLVVGTTDTQSLSNKDLSSSSNAFPASLATDLELANAVAAHAALVKTHGINGSIVGTSDTQSLTNKTIDGLSNTILNVPKTSLTGLTGDVVDTDSVQSLTNKTIPQASVTGLTTEVADTGWVAATAAGFTAGAGLSSMTGGIVRRRHGVVTLQLTGVLSGATGTGNITNISMFIIPAGWVPAQSNGNLGPGASGPAFWAYASTGGNVQMTNTPANIPAGTTVQVMGTYLL